MKKKYIKSLVASMLMLTSMVSAQTNYVTNPGFESDQTEVDKPQLWSEWSGTTLGSSSCSVIQGDAHSGNSKISFTPLANSNVMISQNPSSLQAGTYTLKAWVRSSGTIGHSYMDISNYGGSVIYYSVSNLTANTWTQISIANVNISSGGCKVEFSLSADVNQWFEIDDVSLTYDLSNIQTNVELSSSEKVQIYPTFIKDHLLHISNPSVEKYELTICGLNGQKLYSEKLNSAHSSINIPFLKSGMYIVNVNSQSGSFSQKIVVE